MYITPPPISRDDPLEMYRYVYKYLRFIFTGAIATSLVFCYIFGK